MPGSVPRMMQVDHALLLDGPFNTQSRQFELMAIGLSRASRGNPKERPAVVDVHYKVSEKVVVGQGRALRTADGKFSRKPVHARRLKHYSSRDMYPDGSRVGCDVCHVGAYET